jgi:tetratricopeptide (TPR) repeat protein
MTERLMIAVAFALVAHRSAAQDLWNVPLSQACIEFNRNGLKNVFAGELVAAETAFRDALSDPAQSLGESCMPVLLFNLGFVLDRSGRFKEAEAIIERSIRSFEKVTSPENLILLRPLQMLLVSRLEQGKIGSARHAYSKMLLIRPVGSPEQRAIVHGAGGSLLHAERRYGEAAREFELALAAVEETRDHSLAEGIFLMLANCYIGQGKLEEASRVLDRAFAESQKQDDGPIDRLKLLNARAALFARERQWTRAEENFQAAISIAVTQTRLDPVPMVILLEGYAYVLEKDHHRQESRSIRARAAALRAEYHLGRSVVDATELFMRPGEK